MAEKYHVLLEKLVKIPNPLVRQMEVQHDEKKVWTYGDKVILAVGRVVEIKQQEQLIKCMPYILSRCNEARLVIVGASHGTHSERLKQLVNALGVEEAVLFVGHQSNVKWYYQNSRVFALVSKSWVSMRQDSWISLSSTVCCFFLASFSLFCFSKQNLP